MQRVILTMPPKPTDSAMQCLSTFSIQLSAQGFIVSRNANILTITKLLPNPEKNSIPPLLENFFTPEKIRELKSRGIQVTIE